MENLLHDEEQHSQRQRSILHIFSEVRQQCKCLTRQNCTEKCELLHLRAIIVSASYTGNITPEIIPLIVYPVHTSEY